MVLRFLDLRGCLPLPPICFFVVFDLTFLAAFRGDFLFVLTSKTSGTLCVSNLLPCFLGRVRETSCPKLKRLGYFLLPMHLFLCLVVCCSWEIGVNTLVSRNNHPICNFFELQRQNNLSRSKEWNQITSLTSKLDADSLCFGPTVYCIVNQK